MKKLFLFAAAAAMFAACSETDVLESAQQQAAQQGGVKFDVYAQRGVTRAGGQLGDLNNKNIGANGFGVFAYYTDGDVYGPNAKPNFMYNQQVRMADPTAEAKLGETQWVYEPVKYWPNEFGSAAVSDGVDYVSFFAYAPWTEVEPTTGKIIVPDSIIANYPDSVAIWQNKNIISVNKNSDQGDPIVKYRVDTNPATSVDLLWGVASPKANEAYGAIDGPNGSQGQNANVEIKPGEPFINLVKPNNPVTDKLLFNLKHALAKVKITIDYIDDAETPAGPAAAKIDAAQTRIYVREFKISGWATEGALNLNNTDMAGEPNWKAFDGNAELEFADALTFFDGRKLDNEGKKAGEAKSEKPQGLNPLIVENYDPAETVGTFGEDKNPGVAAMTADAVAEPELVAFDRIEAAGEEGGDENPARRFEDGDDQPAEEGEAEAAEQKAYVGTQLLFGGDPTKNGGFFYIIPRNSDAESVDVEISYDVETIDPALAANISDGLNHGISIANVIRKLAIFGEGVDFKAGYQYVIKLHLGMTSVKIDADVQPWIETDEVDVDLPDNQDPASVDGENADGRKGILPPAGTEVEITGTKYVYNAETMKIEAITGEGIVFVTDGKFVGGMMSGKVKKADEEAEEEPAPARRFDGEEQGEEEETEEADPLETLGLNTDETYYIPATAVKGGKYQLCTFAGTTEEGTQEGAQEGGDDEISEPGAPEVDPSRRFEGEEEGDGEGDTTGETATEDVPENFHATGVFIVVNKITTLEEKEAAANAQTTTPSEPK